MSEIVSKLRALRELLKEKSKLLNSNSGQAIKVTMSAEERDILTYIKQNGPIERKLILKHFGNVQSDRTTRRRLNKIMEYGLVKKKKSGRQMLFLVV